MPAFTPPTHPRGIRDEWRVIHPHSNYWLLWGSPRKCPYVARSPSGGHLGYRRVSDVFLNLTKNNRILYCILLFLIKLFLKFYTWFNVSIINSIPLFLNNSRVMLTVDFLQKFSLRFVNNHCLNYGGSRLWSISISANCWRRWLFLQMLEMRNEPRLTDYYGYRPYDKLFLSPLLSLLSSVSSVCFMIFFTDRLI